MIDIQYTAAGERLQGYIYNIDSVFQYWKEKENGYNLECDTELMKIIDKVDDRKDNVIFFGNDACPIEYLSTGTKTAILALHGYKVFADCMGPNAFAACLGIACKYNKDIWLHMTCLQACRYVGTGKVTVNGNVMTLADANEALIEADEKTMSGDAI